MIITGNTVIDNLLWVLAEGEGRRAFRTGRRKLLLTLHRRESQGAHMREWRVRSAGWPTGATWRSCCRCTRARRYRKSLLPELGGHPCITITEPLDYADFIATLAQCDIVLTDSGGVQEEAPTLGKPVLVLRRRPSGPRRSRPASPAWWVRTRTTCS